MRYDRQPARDLDIEVPRNGSYFASWQITDYEHDPIDLTDYVFEMDARTMAGTGAIISSATITLAGAVDGIINVQWDGSSFASVPLVTEIVTLAYDLKMAGADSVARIIARGQVVLFPGVS